MKSDELQQIAVRAAGKFEWFKTVVSVDLVGSVARGEAKPASDIDLLILTQFRLPISPLNPLFDRYRDCITKRFTSETGLTVGDNPGEVHLTVLPQAVFKQMCEQEPDKFANILSDRINLYRK